MTDQFPECEDLTGRPRKICRGEVKMPLATRNAYRELWGKAPIQIVVRTQTGGPVTASFRAARANPKPAAPKPPKPAGSVGTRLHDVILSLGIKPKPNCGCRALMLEMDNLGVKGVAEKREHYADALRKRADKFGVATWIAAGTAAVLSGLAFKINPLDPMPGLLDEAIRLELEVANAA